MDKENVPLASNTYQLYASDTDTDRKVASDNASVGKSAPNSANSLDAPLSHGSSNASSSAVYQFEIVDAAGLVAGTAEAKEHQSMVEKVARVDYLHKLFFYISIPALLISLIVAISLYATKHIEASTATKGVAICCTIATIVLSVFLIFCHLTAYTNPPQQRLICRILLMAPIYAIDSLIGLFAYKEGSLAAIVRDTYEAYVIYMFYRLLLDYLGSEQRVLGLWREFKPEGIDHIVPMNVLFCFEKCPLNERTLNYMKIALVQYMILRPLLTIMTVPLYFTGHYKEGDFDAGDNAYLYFALIQNGSVFFAFSALVYFYFACKEFLQPYEPGMKFITVKAVVFCCFWQGILIAVINHFHGIPHSQFWTSDDVAVGLQNFLVCLEMFIVAIAHRWVFPDTPYMPLEGRMRLRSWQVKHLFSISDVVDEATLAMRSAPTVFVDHAREIQAERRAAKEASKSLRTLTAAENGSVNHSESETDRPIGE